MIAGPVEMIDCLNGRYTGTVAGDVREGLSATQKYIPSKYFYDEKGSKLFEEICQLPEYYPTRTELSILKRIAPKLMKGFAHRDLVELGSGANLKIRTLLDAVDDANRATLRYVPVDISQSAVIEASEDLLRQYPGLEVLGVLADFTSQMDVVPRERPKMICFLGSTIGNMETDERSVFLAAIAECMGEKDSLLMGFDMLKSRSTLEAAYNDSRGVTAEFNKNILKVVNEAVDGDFDPDAFEHIAFLNEHRSRIEMHLRAKRDCIVRLRSIGMDVSFSKDETIHTENSRKFAPGEIERMAKGAGLKIREWFSDPDGWFSLVLMEREGQA